MSVPHIPMNIEYFIDDDVESEAGKTRHINNNARVELLVNNVPREERKSKAGGG